MGRYVTIATDTLALHHRAAALRLLPLAAGPAAEGIAIDEALLKLRADDLVPDTLVLRQCTPATVLLGLHQPVDLEVRERYTRANGIAIARRITGGGAVLSSDRQLLWSLVVRPATVPSGSEATAIADVQRTAQAAVRETLAAIGIAAEAEADGHLTVRGRRIASIWPTSSRGAVLVQGFIQLTDDVDRAVDSLRAPAEKMPHKEREVVRQRWTDIAQEAGGWVNAAGVGETLAGSLASAFGLPLRAGTLSAPESLRVRSNLARFGAEQWIRRIATPPSDGQHIRSLYKAPAGFLWTYVTVGGDRTTITSVQITGDLVCNPLGALSDLCHSLVGIPNDADAVRTRIEEFYRDHELSTPGLTPEHLAKAVVEAAARTRVAEEWGVTLEEANDLWLVPASPSQPREETLAAVRNADVMLMPYCSKALDCELRFTLDCTACGGCSAGVGYALAKERGMAAVTLCNAEHFKTNLAAMKAQGTRAYVGACCEPFYAKHREEFEQLGVPGLLMNIEKVTCYEVDIDRDDRNEGWKELTDIKVGLITKIMGQVAPQATPSTFKGMPVPAGVQDAKDKGSGKRNSPQSPV